MTERAGAKSATPPQPLASRTPTSGRLKPSLVPVAVTSLVTPVKYMRSRSWIIHWKSGVCMSGRLYPLTFTSSSSPRW